jgi:replicative DNA helicase
MENNESNVLEYETALLGKLINSNESFDKTKGLILHTDFSIKKHQIIFKTIEDVVDRGYSLEQKPIIQLLKEEKNLDKIGGEEYINFLVSEAGLHSNMTKYAKSIVETSRLREVKSQVKSILLEMSNNNISADEVLEKVEMKIISSARDIRVTEFKKAREIVKEVIEEIQKKLAGEQISGLKTEFIDLDKITTGLHGGDLIILAARPSMGKTALALNIAANISKDKKVAFFSIEMPSKQIVNRLIGLTGFIPSYKIQDPKYMTESDKQKFSIASEKIKKLNLYIDDSPGIKLSELV